MAQRFLENFWAPSSPRSDPSTRESRYSVQADEIKSIIWPRPTSTQESSSFRALVNNYPSLSSHELATQYSVVGQIYLSGRFRPAIRLGAIATYLNNELGIPLSPFDVKSLRNMLGMTPFRSQIVDRSQEPIDDLIDSYLGVDACQEKSARELQEYKLELDGFWLEMSLSERRNWHEKWNVEAFWREMPIHPEMLTYGYLSSPETDSFVQRLLPELEIPPPDLFSIVATIWLSYLKIWPAAIHAQSISAFISANLGVTLDPQLIVRIREHLLECAFRSSENPRAKHAMFAITVARLQDVDRWWEHYLKPLDRECLIVLWGTGAKVKLLEAAPYELQGSDF